MKLWKHILMSSLVAGLALSLCATSADAASKKKTKKKAEKKTESYSKKETKPVMHHKKEFVTGTNTMGRAGLLFGDTSDVARVGQVEGSAHITYSSPGAGYDSFGIPFGAHFGAAKNVDLYAAGVLGIYSTPSITFLGTTIGGGSASTFALDLGGKYRIHTGEGSPDFSVGGDILIPTDAGGQVVFTPRGTITYTLTSGLLLNGDMGIHISTLTYVSFDAGLGVPFSDKFSGIVEVGANQMGDYGSVLAGGVRFATSDSFKLQGLLGIPLNGGGVIIGGGIILASK